MPRDPDGGEDGVAGDIVRAWNSGRTPPIISIEDVAFIFASRRDAIEKFDVTYKTTSQMFSGAADPVTWWTSWRQDGMQARRVVAPVVEGLDPDHRHPATMQWQSDRGVVSFGRLNESMRPVPEVGASMLGVEDSWLGAGACIGSIDAGFSRASEHDLGALLERLPSGAAVVETAPVMIQEAACVVLRLGWPRPYWIYLDPELDFGPRRIDRILDLAGVATLSRTTMDQFVQCGGQWLPTRFRWSQHPLGAGRIGPGDDPESEADWVLAATAHAMAVNGEACDCLPSTSE